MLIAAVVTGVQRFELIALLLSIAFVLIAEMINTAVEAAIDVATTSFDPLAKLAKDIAAGAVLIATVNAVVVGYLVFSVRIVNKSSHLIERLRDAPAEVTLVALVLTIIVVIATKAYTGRGTPLRGGLPSGHAAVAFAGWMAVTHDRRRLAALVPDLDAGVHHGAARGPDSRRIRRSLGRRGDLRRGARCARDADRLPGVRVTPDLELLAEADAAAANAYAPYSKFHVGAAVRTQDGRLFLGVNVENAAYPLGICAERSVIARPREPATGRATSRRSRSRRRRAAAVASGSPSSASRP